MKFKVLKGTTLFNKLMVLRRDMIAAEQAAADLAAEFGSDTFIASREFQVIAGGLEGIMMDNKPATWVKAFPKHYPDVYIPAAGKPENRDILARIAALPVVRSHDYNTIIGFKPQEIRLEGKLTVTLVSNCSLALKEGMFLIACNPNAEYEPVAGMTEILESEFKKLMALPEVQPTDIIK